ncbi:MAG: carboxypeptidase-like regulatory domain-containing protein, partial [Saprospiraceae bacterium]|nr:carboxypeptidase-like regulatory domain-containing protein [Saprospiraceae bacterium]
MKKSLLSAFLMLFALLQVAAQGTISGTISDLSTGETLIGANVVIDGTSTGTSTDFDGKYQFDAPAGTYTIYISYIGYQDKRVEGVVIQDNQVTYLDVSLSDQAIDLGVEITVTAAAIERSENAILLLQRKSDKIQDGISSQEMSKFAVSDAAGAMKKVTGATVQGGKYINIRGLGDRYSLTQLNDLVIPSTDPYRNAAQLDLIPTSLLENIITSKTFTPDQPGNFTGGNVNIKTKSFPEQFTFTISASAGYNPQNNLIDNFLTHAGGSNDYWGYDDGGRAIPATINDQTRPLLNDNSEVIARLGRPGGAEAAQALDGAVRSLNRQFEPTTMQTPLDHSLSMAFGNQYSLFGRPLGVIMSASFKQSYLMLDRFEKANWVLEDINSGILGNQGNFEDTQSTQNPTLNGLFGLAYKFSNLSSINFNFIYNHNTEKLSRSLFGERPDNIINPDFLEGRSLSFNERTINNYQLSGTHVVPALNNLKIEWKGSYTESSQDEPMTRFFENQFNVPTGLYTLPLSNIQRPFYFFRYLADEQISGKIDLELPIGKGNTKFKFGSLVTLKDRDFIEERFQVSDKGRGERSITELNGDVNAWMADNNIGIMGLEGARYTLGNYYAKLERYEEAIITYKEAIGIDPGYVPAYFDLGITYGRLER